MKEQEYSIITKNLHKHNIEIANNKIIDYLTYNIEKSTHIRNQEYEKAGNARDKERKCAKDIFSYLVDIDCIEDECSNSDVTESIMKHISNLMGYDVEAEFKSYELKTLPEEYIRLLRDFKLKLIIK